MSKSLQTYVQIKQIYSANKLSNWPATIGRNMQVYCKGSKSTMLSSKSWLSWCLLLITLLTVPVLISGLKDVSVTIPQAVKRGSNALLICNYDMENDTLYSVKWYKGRREFYRYTPKENPAMKVFPMAAGLNVERNLSNQSHVVLLAVPLNISGKFTCEISVEAPTFQTAMVSGELEVVELPEEQAIVTGIQPRYRIGDLVDGNCSIKYSKPAANLTWTINGIVVPLHHIKTYQIERYDDNNLESVVSALHFMVTTQHFIKGQMRLKCTASIFDIFKEEIESVIEEDRPRIMASGRSYDMHNNYPYEQHASGDGFDDHNESFLTYSAADITSTATTIHAQIYAKVIKMHWINIYTGMMASMEAIRAFTNQWKHPALELEHSSVKWISGVSNDEVKGKVATTTKNMFTIGKGVTYAFTIIFVTVFLRALLRHFISCQIMCRKSKTKEGENGRMPSSWRTSAIVAQLTTSNVLLLKVIEATTKTIAKKPTLSTMILKQALKGRKSFHNCIEKKLKSFSVHFGNVILHLLKMLKECATVKTNPLQKLQLFKQQKQTNKQQKEQRKYTEILRNEAHLKCNINEQLSITDAIGGSTPPLPATLNALTFDKQRFCKTMHAAFGIHRHTNTTCSSRNREKKRSNSDSCNNQAISNLTKDTSKDQTLLMMIAQGFHCQRYDNFVTFQECTSCIGQKQLQQQNWSLAAIKNDKLKEPSFTFHWQEECIPRSSCRFNC